MPTSKPLVLDNEQMLWQLFPRLPILSSGEASWDSIYLEYHCQPSHEVPEICSIWHGIIMFPEATAPIEIERTLNGRFQRNSVMAGDIAIAPASVGHSSCWDAEHSFLLLGLEPTFFARTIDESVLSAQVELVPHFATPDLLIFQMGLALKKILLESSNSLESRLYTDSVATLLASQLLQYYSVRKTVVRNYAGGLSKHKLQQVIDYINENIHKDLSLDELAGVVELSRHYFSDLFKKSTGLTPHQYVVQCRVERAKQLLLKGELPIADVATSAGFSDQSHLNRWFKRLVGTTPKVFMQG